MKDLDESREVETARESRSTKELDKLAEGNDIKQVIEDNFEEKRMRRLIRKKDLARSRRQK